MRRPSWAGALPLLPLLPRGNQACSCSRGFWYFDNCERSWGGEQPRAGQGRGEPAAAGGARQLIGLLGRQSSLLCEAAEGSTSQALRRRRGQAGPGNLGLGGRGGNRLWGAGVGPQCAQPLQSSWTPFPGLPEVKHWCRSFPSAKEAAVRCATGTFARLGRVLTLATQESTFLPVPHLPAEAKPSSDPPESSCCLSSQSTYMAWPRCQPSLHHASSPTWVLPSPSPPAASVSSPHPPEPICHSPRPPSAAPTAENRDSHFFCSPRVLQGRSTLPRRVGAPYLLTKWNGVGAGRKEGRAARPPCPREVRQAKRKSEGNQGKLEWRRDSQNILLTSFYPKWFRPCRARLGSSLLRACEPGSV